MKGKERIHLCMEHQETLTKSGILGIGAPFGGKIQSALVERLQKFCQPGGY